MPVLKEGGAAHWTEVAVSVLGATVVVSQGAQRVFRFSDTWPEYRRASERMKREWRHFINQIGHYGGPELRARTRYIEALEEIIAEEQKIFFAVKVEQDTVQNGNP